jgi:hypothetical protein
MKNKLFVGASLIFLWVGFYVNTTISASQPFRLYNLLLSLGYIAFWIVMLRQCGQSRAVMRYIAVLWGLCAVTAFFNLFYTNGTFLLLFMLLLAPLFGIQFVIADAIVCIIIIGVFSLGITITAFVFLRRLKRAQKEGQEEEE